VHATSTPQCSVLKMPTEEERPGMYARPHRPPQALQRDPGYGEYMKFHYPPQRRETQDSLLCKECGIAPRPATTPPELSRRHSITPPPDRHHSRSVVQPGIPIRQDQRRTRRTQEPVAATRAYPDSLRSRPVKAHKHAQPTLLQAPQAQRPFVRSQTLPQPRNVIYSDVHDSIDTLLWTPARQALISAAIIPPVNKFMSYRSRERLSESYTDSNDIPSRRDTPVTPTLPLSFATHPTQSVIPQGSELFFNDHPLKDDTARTVYYREHTFSNDQLYEPPTLPGALNRTMIPPVDIRAIPPSPDFARDDAETEKLTPVSKIPPFRPLGLYLPAGPSLHDQVFDLIEDENDNNDIWYGFNKQWAFREKVMG
jgi:hypothetical protein